MPSCTASYIRVKGIDNVGGVKGYCLEACLE